MAKLIGLVMVAGGFALMLVSFRADELGMGEHKGIGYKHVRMTIASVLVMGVGVLFLMVPKRENF